MSLNTTPRTWVAGEVPTAANFNTELRDAFVGIQAAWTTYTPTLFNWTLGNGVVAGRYLRIGKTIFFQLQYTVGSTDTKSGVLTIGLPPAAARARNARACLGMAAIEDVGTAFYHRFAVLDTNGAQMDDMSGAQVTHLVPFTFATGDKVDICGSYEAA